MNTRAFFSKESSPNNEKLILKKASNFVSLLKFFKLYYFINNKIKLKKILKYIKLN